MPMPPLPEIRSAVVPVKVKLPERVIVEALAASKVNVVADELPPIVMLDTDEILSVVPTVEAPSVIELDSFTDAKPVVLNVMVPASVIRGVAKDPISPEPETRFIDGAVRENVLVRVMVPLPLAVKFIVAAELEPVTVIPPFEAVLNVRVVPIILAPRFTESDSAI